MISIVQTYAVIPLSVPSTSLISPYIYIYKSWYLHILYQSMTMYVTICHVCSLQLEQILWIESSNELAMTFTLIHSSHYYSQETADIYIDRLIPFLMCCNYISYPIYTVEKNQHKHMLTQIYIILYLPPCLD